MPLSRIAKGRRVSATSACLAWAALVMGEGCDNRIETEGEAPRIRMREVPVYPLAGRVRIDGHAPGRDGTVIVMLKEIRSLYLPHDRSPFARCEPA